MGEKETNRSELKHPGRRKKGDIGSIGLVDKIVGLYPGGSPSRNSRRPRVNPGLRGGLEIVFNQQ
ncbi:uncharacterized protein LOC110814889 [Carica papaya]|uniref:uncharacterized protein LOC110814889 n=1 Tax=Carica papaya TaxID=3649 RepID=UPI000B8CB004|nr:uncharacterized protein LOC110814889 [Carica papaya]